MDFVKFWTCAMQKIKIDIVSDVSCPWCIIGYKGLEAAINEMKLTDLVDINWKAFELNPGMPKLGQDKREHLAQKYGSTPSQIMSNRQVLIDRGASVGFTFNYKEDSRVYNTFDAHRLIHWAKNFALQSALKLKLFDLYFTDNGNPSNREELVQAASDVGLDAEKANEILESDTYANEVMHEQGAYRQAGIQSVPSFIFNDKHLITGGQPKETFIQFFEQLLKDSK